MKKHSLLILPFLFLLLTIALSAQTPFIFRGKILDAETNRPLDKVNVFNQTEVNGGASSDDGTFGIRISVLPAVIIFSSIGYENFLLTVDEVSTESVTIRLQPSSFGLPEVAVTDQPKIEKLTDESYTVKDFIISDDRILVLTFPSIFSGNKLILKDWDGKVLDQLPLKKVKGKSMHQGCLGNIHLLAKKYAYEISIIADQIQLIKKYPKSQYEELIEPCVLSSEDLVYWKGFKALDQILTYTIISKEPQKIIKKIMVADFENLSRRKDDFVLELENTGSYNALTWIERQSWNQLFYKPIFSPLHLFDNQLYLFNHTKGYLEFFDLYGKNIRYVPITYHQNLKWEKRILFDKIYNKAYTVYSTSKGKSIYEISLENGTVAPIVFFDARFVDKMVVFKGYLFYLESGVTDKNRVLHQLKL
ncbi:MAG: carboxypeptidase-like regulatory domain-containing protein [Bacteroidota bacterium]